MAGALSMPPRVDPESVLVSTAIMGGRKLTDDAGSLGKFRFEAARSLGGSAEIKVVGGSFGSGQGTRKFESDSHVRLINADAPPMEDARGSQNPPGEQPSRQGQSGQGFQPPPEQGHAGQGQPGQGFQPPPGRGTSGDGRSGQGFQPPPGQGHQGQGQSGQGFQPPPGRGRSGQGQHPQGPGSIRARVPEPPRAARLRASERSTSRGSPRGTGSRNDHTRTAGRASGHVQEHAENRGGITASSHAGRTHDAQERETYARSDEDISGPRYGR